MTTTTAPQVSITRVVSAPRTLVWRAFTQPDQLASFSGPHGNVVDGVELDVRPGGFMKWHETFPRDRETWTKSRLHVSQWLPEDLAAPTTAGWG